MWVMLSPQEREPAMAGPGKSLNGEHSPALENLLLLPGGEGPPSAVCHPHPCVPSPLLRRTGRGEGEREFQLNSHGLEGVLLDALPK